MTDLITGKMHALRDVLAKLHDESNVSWWSDRNADRVFVRLERLAGSPLVAQLGGEQVWASGSVEDLVRSVERQWDADVLNSAKAPHPDIHVGPCSAYTDTTAAPLPALSPLMEWLLDGATRGWLSKDLAVRIAEDNKEPNHD